MTITGRDRLGGRLRVILLWAAHDVKKKAHGTMRLSHPLMGELTLRYEALARSEIRSSRRRPTTPSPVDLSAGAGVPGTERIHPIELNIRSSTRAGWAYPPPGAMPQRPAPNSSR
ncbi:hypothetical protein AB0M44_23365 [Streptosporangium subroseum]|uniref:MmyB family transcriptional regulator n=1 Tax=Streptosporangium subroseum TaxID=106412 RepID=UPI003420FF66